MKKCGFTLSELIVALGLIGVIAAITTPMITSIIPDKDKILVLKVKKEIYDITSELLSNPSYYSKKYTNDGKLIIGLADYEQPAVWSPTPPTTFDFYKKYPVLFASQLQLKDNPVAAGSGSGGTVTFTTADGISWRFSCAGRVCSGNSCKMTHSLTIDKDGFDKGKNKSAVKNPDQFQFNISETGAVTGSDALTQAYLNNPHKLNSRKEDYTTAKIK